MTCLESSNETKLVGGSNEGILTNDTRTEAGNNSGAGFINLQELSASGATDNAKQSMAPKQCMSLARPLRLAQKPPLCEKDTHAHEQSHRHRW
jgi:hypothetical protein